MLQDAPPRGNNKATKRANLDPAPTNHNIQFARTKLNTVSIGAQIMLTHCGRVTQICVFTLQLCKTDDANLRF